MKPDFALDFRDNQIALLHRQEAGWAIIGRVAMDDPDLDAAMAYLRATALGLSPRGVSSKLILPNEAILYTEIANLPYGNEQRAAAIEQGLVGRTPYELNDLVYDWSDAGACAHVAVIARETLEEAEGFASQHRFNPVSFAALPDQGGYDGEVWFGATQLSETLLAKGEVIERDDVTLLAPDVGIAPSAELAASDFEMGAAHSTEPLGDDVTAAEADLGPVDAQEKPSPTELSEVKDTREVLADFVLDESAQHAVAADVASSGAGLMPQNMPEAALDSAPEAQPASLQSAAEDRQQNLPASFEAAFDETPEASDATPLDEVEEAPMAVDVPLIDDLPPAERFGEKPQSRAEKMLAAFAARRDAALAKAESETNARRLEPMLRATPADANADWAQRGLPLDEGRQNAAADLPAPPALVPEPLQQDVVEVVAKGRDQDAVNAAPATNLPKLGVPEAKLGRAPEVAAASGLRPAIVKHVPAKQQSHKPQDLKSMPRPKARPRLGMRLGWILTALLLLALVAASALSEYMLTSFNALYGDDSEFVSVEPAQNSVPAAENQTAQIIAGATSIAPKAPVADLPAPQVVSPSAAATAQIAKAPSATPLAQTTPPASPPDLSLPLPAAVALVPDLAPSPIAGATVGETTALERAGAALPVPLPRPPEVTRAANVVPAVLAVTGKPALVPGPRPDIVLAAASVARPATSAPELSALPAADPALSGANPLPRPASVLAAAVAAAPAPALGPPPAADPALADARPIQRPENILSAARAARLASAPASLVADAEAAIAEAALNPAPLVDDPNLSPLNVAVSRIPAPRPAGLKSAFEQALAAAAALDPVPEASPPAEEVASNAAPADESVEQDIGLDGAAAERSVVAKQATQRNMLNLQDTNLVGIFGSQSNRYALIRQPGGSFKKLKVGDRFDGGRIAAITESEVRYEKGGDLLALRMPKI